MRRGARRGPPPIPGLVLAVLAVLLSAWTLPRGAAAGLRHELSPPSRSLPARDDNTAERRAFAPQEIRKLLADGSADGTTTDGRRIRLSIDERLQKDMFELFRRFDPPYGVCVAMEPKTGRIVCMVGYRKGGEPDPWLPLKALYPAASLIKVVTAAAALEKGALSPGDAIAYRGGIYRITKRGLHARNGRGVPTMSLEEAIARSANSVFGKVAVDNVGGDVLEEYMGKFGFGQTIPFELPLETSRFEVPRDEYNLARTGAGFGEVYVSPLHMAMMMSAIGARGEMPAPVLVELVEDAAGGLLYEADPAKWRDTVAPETADALLGMMVKTIEMGTSRRTFGSADRTPLLKDMAVAGKTGSLSGWTPRMRFEWFAGVAPVGDARLAVAALVVNSNRWKIKGSYVGKEAFSAYFGYPQSNPPIYKVRGKKRWKGGAVKKRAGKRPRARGRRMAGR
ncbi:MAG: penicillin-binding transpeptidase domain-containing protein [Deltaproteobacteria bacterium]